MRATIARSIQAHILRVAVPWQRARFYHRESKVGGHTVRSVPVRGETEVQAPATLVHSVVDNEDLQQAMKALNISELTEIQELAYPMILDKKDVMVASHTGSGKTLAYLLPIAQELKRQEVQDGFVGKPRRPRVIVLSPTRELTEQIAGVSRQLSHHVKLRTVALSTGTKPSLQKRSLASPVDILVSTPQHVVAQMSEGALAISDVQYLVLDEADTIFEGGFGQDVYSIVRPLRKRGAQLATVLVSATMNAELKRAVEAEFPNMVKAETSSLHKGIKGSNHVFMPLQPGQDKLQALYQVLSGEFGRRCMVFCNSISSCRAVDYHLAEGGVSTVCFHGDIPIPARKTAIERFTGSFTDHSPSTSSSENGSAPDLPPIQGDDGLAMGDQPVLVCTDLAARGLDMPARVHHVINFDFPSSAKDYLHRSGRTARAGATGTVTSLLQTALERALASRIEQGLKKNEAIDELSTSSVLQGRGSDAGRGVPRQKREGGRSSSLGRGVSAGRGSGGRGPGRGSGGRGRSRSTSQKFEAAGASKGSNHQHKPKFVDGPGKGKAGSWGEEAQSSRGRGGRGSGRGSGPPGRSSGTVGRGGRSAGRGSGRDDARGGRARGRSSGRDDTRSAGRGSGRDGGRGAGRGSGRDGGRARGRSSGRGAGRGRFGR